MTTSRNNTIMSWMAYTDFLSRLRIAAGILLPLNTRTLLLYPGGRDCIGAAGVDAYAIEDTRLQFSAEGTATFMLDDDYIAHKELSSVGAIENDHNVTLRLEWENGEVVYECPVAVKYEPPIVRS